MYYLVIENLGRKRCIDSYEKNIYKDDQYYNCLKKLPFDEKGKAIVGKVNIRCVANPEKQTEATVYTG